MLLLHHYSGQVAAVCRENGAVSQICSKLLAVYARSHRDQLHCQLTARSPPRDLAGMRAPVPADLGYACMHAC